MYERKNEICFNSLKLEGEVTIRIDKQKYQADAKWDGLKGYTTNTKLISRPSKSIKAIIALDCIEEF